MGWRTSGTSTATTTGFPTSPKAEWTGSINTECYPCPEPPPTRRQSSPQPPEIAAANFITSLTSTDNADLLVSSFGDSRIEASAGNDTLISGAGNDKNYTGQGKDLAFSYSGADFQAGQDNTISKKLRYR